MSSTIDRRSFLTHSAATVGGIAMAGSVVDGMLAGVAGAATGVAKGKPKLGGTLTVGTVVRRAQLPHFQRFIGQIGRLGLLCRQRPVRPALCDVRTMARSWLPMLALSAKSSSNYTVWTIALRHGVQFHDGTNFDASVVVANYNAAAANATVGTRDSANHCLGEGDQLLHRRVHHGRAVCPFSDHAVRTANRLHGRPLGAWVNTTAGHPIGTGPFKFKSWSVGVESQFTKNPKYWRKDGAGRRLPYLDGINFKTIVDPQSRNEALQIGFGGHDPPGERRPDQAVARRCRESR